MRFQAVRRHPTGSSIYRQLRAILGLLCMAMGLGIAQPALSAPIMLTFDGYTNGTTITSQYQSVGVMVSGAKAIEARFTPWQAYSDENVADAPTGLISFILDPAITGNIHSASLFLFSFSSVGMYAYDADGVLVGQEVTPGAVENLFLTVESSGNPIARIEIHDSGSDFQIDTVSFNSVPEPATGWLLSMTLLGLSFTRRASKSM